MSGRAAYQVGWAVVVVLGMVLGGVAVVPPGISAQVTQIAPASPGASQPLLPIHAGPAGAAAPPSIPSTLVPHLESAAPAMAHYPSAWGSSHLPPGAPVPATPAGMTAAQFDSEWSGNSSYHYVDGACYGKWPADGQAGYDENCYGHDEPGLEPFSNLPGSGGNVTWNVSLPVDRTPTQNQSDLYTAIWFGMNLYDPYGYDGQCFLELQMYPDTNGAGLVQTGVWSAFAVAWQIQLSTGQENPCYQAPLNLGNTTGGIQFNQGDALNVTMTGWVGSPYGENITVTDLTTHQSGSLNLYNHQLNYPLNPAYLTNNIDDSLTWSPGGDLPVSFAFESGHTFNGPSNDSYGGCNSGVPPPNAIDGATPCDSYDPQSWANDTLVPWHFYPTTFFNAHHRQVAVQVGFIQDFGGIAWIDPLSNGACLGRDGSEFCSYPWYSYLGAVGAYTFGATDYLGTTADFGQYDQYATTLEGDSSGLAYFAVNNFTAPLSGGLSLRLVIVGGGSVTILNHTTMSSITLPHLRAGGYSVNAVAPSGGAFQGYSATGGLALDAARTSWSSFTLSANATLTVTFGSSPLPSVAVRFASSGANGSVGVDPGFIDPVRAQFTGLAGVGFDTQVTPASLTVPTAGVRSLTPGMYSFLAYPPAGYVFSGWSSTSSVYVFTPESNYTWANVTGAGVVTAHYTASPVVGLVRVFDDPAQGGRVQLGGHLYASGTSIRLPVGAYPIVALPNATYAFDTWGALWSGTMSNFSRTSILLVQGGTTTVDALFNSTPIVTILPSAGGTVALRGVQTSGAVALPQVLNGNYPIAADPSPGFAFSGWTLSTPGKVSVLRLGSSITNLTVSGSGSITARFHAAPTTFSLTLDSLGGSFAFATSTTVSARLALSSVSAGNYTLVPLGTPSTAFVDWTATGAVKVVRSYVANALLEYLPSYTLDLTGNGTLTGHFAPRTFPVTFVDEPSSTGAVLSISGSGGTTVLFGGGTANLVAGAYTLALSGGRVTAPGWTATSNLTLGGASGLTVPVTVAGSGTIYALAVSAPLLHSAIANPATPKVNTTVHVTVSVFGGTMPFTFAASSAASNPAGALTCAAAVTTGSNTTVLSCTPSTTGPLTIDVTVTDARGAVVHATVGLTAHPVFRLAPTASSTRSVASSAWEQGLARASRAPYR